MCIRDSVTACRAADLAVTKTATGSYDTTYLWDVSKTLDASVPGSAPAGTTVPLPYAVVATKIGQTDAAWVIKGTITVTNPNTWEPVSYTHLDVYKRQAAGQSYTLIFTYDTTKSSKHAYDYLCLLYTSRCV